MSDSKQPKIAVVHEWLSIVAGSEKVVGELLALYPNADLFALVDFFGDEERKLIMGKRAQTSFIQRLPFAKTSFRAYLPLMPLAVEQFDVSDYDVVISSHHAVAKGVLTHQNQLHVCYCHSPMRYAWDFYHEYLREAKLNEGLKGAFAKAMLHYLRLWDVASANRVDEFVANSHYIARRVKRVYNRDATVIYPPVDVEKFSPNPNKDDYYLAVARFVPYKKVDVILEAFARMPDKKLALIGEGDKTILKKATRNVEVIGFQPFESLKKHLASAKAFVYAAEEDFGITLVEAQACGTPVIAFGKGGATETVIDGETGVLFDAQTPESLIRAVERFERMEFDPAKIRRNAERFDRAVFAEKIKAFIDEKRQAFLQTPCAR
ncbi:MAG: glycosyltransferase family 4 protein [Chloroherpetonaceae bacterium]|nr:glycosyltransferase family 4 protein [Chloroherpetonaceae bacterium]MDW8438226.1 glycosyltransferase family 4 protein [Chloroherpetonaceae bacterium]